MCRQGNDAVAAAAGAAANDVAGFVGSYVPEAGLGQHGGETLGTRPLAERRCRDFRQLDEVVEEFLFHRDQVLHCGIDGRLAGERIDGFVAVSKTRGGCHHQAKSGQE